MDFLHKRYNNIYGKTTIIKWRFYINVYNIRCNHLSELLHSQWDSGKGGGPLVRWGVDLKKTWSHKDWWKIGAQQMNEKNVSPWRGSDRRM